jgi:hypothetical protein
LEIITRARFFSIVRRWGIHLALILLIFKSRLNCMSGSYRETNAFSYKFCTSSNQILYFLTIFCKVTVFGRRGWGALFTESTPLLNFLHHRVTNDVTINTTYFVKYVFRLYTKNTAVIDIGPYLDSERRPFPNHFSFSIHE